MRRYSIGLRTFEPWHILSNKANVGSKRQKILHIFKWDFLGGGGGGRGIEDKNLSLNLRNATTAFFFLWTDDERLFPLFT